MKEEMMETTTKLIGTLAIAFGCVAAAPAAAQQLGSNDSLKELSAQWWQWALSIPAATNPVYDTNGQYCMVGQRGPVWFLAGTFTGLPTQRTCSVPEGVDLFFPVVNQAFYNSPGCGQPNSDISVKEQRAIIAPVIDSATNLSVKLDNAPVGNLHRVRSVVFPTYLPNGAGCPAGVYSPSVDDGIYVRLERLSVGQHHLSIQGMVPGFMVDVFYTLNVVRTLTK
jgi:hypothetical protein